MEQTQLNKNEALKNGNDASNRNEKKCSEKEIHFISSLEKPLIAITEKEIDNEQYFIGYFSYRLDFISKISSAVNKEMLQWKAYEWHKNLIQSASNYQPNVAFSIRFVHSPGKVENNNKSSITIFFTATLVSDTPEKTRQETILLLEDLHPQIELNSSDYCSPFFFSPVNTENELKNEVPFNQELDFYILNRPSIQIKEQNKIGFAKVDSKNLITPIIFPQPPKISDYTLENFLRVLNRSKKFVEVRLLLKPVELDETEKVMMKKCIDKFNLCLPDLNSNEEIENCCEYSKKLLQNYRSLFYVNVVIATKLNELLPKQIVSATGGAFCEQQYHEGIAKVPTEKQNQFFFSTPKKGKGDFKYYYTCEDVCNSFRLPSPQENGLLGIKFIHSSLFTVPENLSESGILLGEKDLSGRKIKIHISENDLRRHLYLLGQTGVGKTTLIKTMIFDLINKGEGIALVDPHGDLLKTVYENIPQYRRKDVILFDPTDLKNNHIRLNILEFNPEYPEQRTFIFNELMKLLNELYNMREVGGPGFELYFRTFMLLVMNTIKGTLPDVIRTFRDQKFRDSLLEICKNEEIKSTIANILNNTGDQRFDNWVPYITNKFNRFVSDDFIAPIISESVSNINFREIIDTKKILLVRLSKGKLGDEGIKFLGTIILNRLILAAYSRENINEKDRVDFTLFVDEFQNFTSSDICTALAEARKYHLRLVLANQNFGQLDSNILKNLLGNVGNLITFRPGLHDAFLMEPYFNPFFSAQDLLEFPNFNCIARLLIDNMPSKPFVFQTIA
jgi:hypothetical protein